MSRGDAIHHGRAAGLGARVRALRRERGLTLKALGGRAGLSHPFLSQLERGLARPSVGSVERIADALEVPVGRLWSPPPSGGASVARSGRGPLFGSGDPLQAREWSGGADWTEAAAAGTVLVYVVRGSVELELDGAVHALSEGDAMQFDGSRGHRIRRTGGAGTRALYVTA